MNHLEMDVRAAASNLRKWSKVVKLPSGNFFNEDLEDAAEMLDEYAVHLAAASNRER